MVKRRKESRSLRDKIKGVYHDPGARFGLSSFIFAIPGGLGPMIFTFVEMAMASGVAIWREFSSSANNGAFLSKHAGSPLIAEGMALGAAGLSFLRETTAYGLSAGSAYLNWAVYCILKGGQINGWEPKIFDPDSSKHFIWRDVLGRPEFYSSMAVLCMSGYLFAQMGPVALLWAGLGAGMTGLVLTNSHVHPHKRIHSANRLFNRLAKKEMLPDFLRQHAQRAEKSNMYLSNNFIARSLSWTFQWAAGSVMLGIGLLEMWGRKTFIPTDNVYFGIASLIGGSAITKILKHDYRRENPYASFQHTLTSESNSHKINMQSPSRPKSVPRVELDGRAIGIPLKRDYTAASGIVYLKPDPPDHVIPLSSKQPICAL